MEANSSTKSQKWEVSDSINVKEFLSKWNDDVFQYCASTTDDPTEAIAKKMKMSRENIQELENVCSLDLLKTDMDSQTERWKLLEYVPEDLSLMCTRFQTQEIEHRKKDRLYRSNINRKLKYKQSDCMNWPTNTALTKQAVPENFHVLYPDVIITVVIHRPVKIRSKHIFIEGRSEQFIQSSTLMVLGRQKLTDLRDLIRCVHDLTVAGDLSENPDSEQVYAKDMFKSGLFYIDGVFYNDMREQDSRDYSKIIIDWARDKKVADYTSKKMEETTFLDLTLKLGEPYLYMHQGDCEHMIIFTDIKLLLSDDPQDMRDYPFLMRKKRRNRTMCRLCQNLAARWITYGSRFTPENPCFFCDVCFRCLHYDSNNRKKGNFEAYKFFDHHAIV